MSSHCGFERLNSVPGAVVDVFKKGAHVCLPIRSYGDKNFPATIFAEAVVECCLSWVIPVAIGGGALRREGEPYIPRVFRIHAKATWCDEVVDPNSLEFAIQPLDFL